MVPQSRPPGREIRTSAPDEEVVRLPVSDADLASQLEEMPAPSRPQRRQPTPLVDLHEEEAEETVVPTPTELGMPWEEEEQERRDTPVGWIALIGLVLLGLGGWAVAKLASGEEEVQKRAERIEEGWEREASSWDDAEKLFVRVEREARAYLAAPSVAEKATFVRHRARVAPLMKAHYERHEFEPLVLESVEAFRPFAIAKKPFIYLAVKVAGGKIRHLSLEEMPGGELKFDWESEVAYLPVDIEDYLATKPTEPVDLRVYAKIDSFYSFEFSDATRYRALILTLRDSPEFLWAYIERGTEDEKALTKILFPKYRIPSPVMLRVRFLPETRGRRSVLVERLVSPRWIYAEDPGGEPRDEGDPGAP